MNVHVKPNFTTDDLRYGFYLFAFITTFPFSVPYKHILIGSMKTSLYFNQITDFFQSK